MKFIYLFLLDLFFYFAFEILTMLLILFIEFQLFINSLL